MFAIRNAIDVACKISTYSLTQTVSVVKTLPVRWAAFKTTLASSLKADTPNTVAPPVTRRSTLFLRFSLEVGFLFGENCERVLAFRFATWDRFPSFWCHCCCCDCWWRQALQIQIGVTLCRGEKPRTENIMNVREELSCKPKRSMTAVLSSC